MAGKKLAPSPLTPPAPLEGPAHPQPYLARCSPPFFPPGLCAPRPAVATAPRGPGAPGLLPRHAGPHGRRQQRGLACLQAAALTLCANRSAGVLADAALAGRGRRLSHSPRVDFALSGQLRDADGLPGMRGPWWPDPERRRRLLGKVAEQEPLPRHMERQRLSRTPFGHGPRGIGLSPPGAGGRAPITAGAKGKVGRAWARTRFVGGEAAGGGAAWSGAARGAEVQPYAGKQSSSGGDSNLCTIVRARTRAGRRSRWLVETWGALLSAPATGSARPG